MLLNLAFYLADQYIKNMKDKNLLKNDKIFEIKNYITDNLNNLILHNLNSNSLIIALNDKLNHE